MVDIFMSQHWIERLEQIIEDYEEDPEDLTPEQEEDLERARWALKKETDHYAELTREE